MRRILIAGLMVLFALGAPAVANAQTSNPPGLAQVEAILASYPDGGPGLQQAIAAAIEANPNWAAAVAVAAQNASVAQQQSLGLGLSEAVATLERSGTADGLAAAQQIVQAVASAPPALQASFTVSSVTTGQSLAGGSTSTPNQVSSQCISPSAPGNKCTP